MKKESKIKSDASELNERVSSLQGLVKKVARKFVGRGLEFDDLVQEGNIGLLFAIENFDEGNGASFETYAALIIQKYIKDALRALSQPIRISDYFSKVMMKVRRAQEDFRRKFGAEPDENDIAEMTDLPVVQVREAMSCLAPILRLDWYSDKEDEEGYTTNCMVELAKEPECIRMIYQDPKRLVKELMKRLTGKERIVIKLLYGIDCNNGEEMRVKDVAYLLGCTERNVIYLKQSAIAKMREWSSE